MTRRRKLKLNDTDTDEVVVEDTPVEVAAPINFTVAVEHHTHAGVSYNLGDPIVIDNPLMVEKLMAKGIIS